MLLSGLKFVVRFVSASLLYGALMKRTLLAFAVAAASAAPGAFAENEIWTTYEIEKSATERLPLILSLNAEVRFEPDAVASQFVLRPGIGFQVNDRLEISAGYRYGQTVRDGDDQIEHRLWQQAEYDLFKVGKVEIEGRTRLEQRQREGADGTGWRVRQRISLERPLEGTSLTLVVSDEAFIGFAETPWGNADGLQENRARVEIEWKAAGIGWEAGYLNRYRNGVNGAEDTTEHNISLGISKEF
ncbi:MAG: hypothetical protein C0421_13370 [Hyphomonas sp.]|nr:hypothetical protein [Hyphomonas sp.]